MPGKRKKILIDAQKCVMGDNDGIQRYGVELLRRLAAIAAEEDSEWDIDVYVGLRFIFNLQEIYGLITSESVGSKKPLKLKAFLCFLHIKRFIAKVLLAFPERAEETLISIKMAITAFISRFTSPLDLSHYDLVHLLLPQAYKVVSHSKTKAIVVTAHDLSHQTFPRFHKTINIKRAQAGFDFCVSHGAGFIAVSEATRQDLLHTYPELSPDNAHTVHEACDARQFLKISDPTHCKQVREKYGIPEVPYLLTLSTLEPRKNLINTIRAFLLLIKERPELDVHLVIAGKKGWKYEELFKDRSLRSSRIVFTGFIADEDLAALYSRATALSYISFYEGFGLPLLEAMSCGAPVIYGANSSMPEVVGAGGLPAQPDNIENMKQQLKRIFIDDDLRLQLAEDALHQAKKFSWERCAQETLNAYDAVIRKKRV